MFFKWLVLGKSGLDDPGREPADSTDNTISVEHRVFAVKQFF
jgi:hypothetical protein